MQSSTGSSAGGDDPVSDCTSEEAVSLTRSCSYSSAKAEHDLSPTAAGSAGAAVIVAAVAPASATAIDGATVEGTSAAGFASVAGASADATVLGSVDAGGKAASLERSDSAMSLDSNVNKLTHSSTRLLMCQIKINISPTCRLIIICSI